MTQRILYRYPFDEEGREILTLVESIAAMQELERQINRLCGCEWRWCDLQLSIVERHPTYLIYEIHHHRRYAGQAIVMPYASAKDGPGSAFTDHVLYLKICARMEAKAMQ
ncbi:MAG TPA: hypothetical protein VL990_03190 [Acidobacteriaceae bacterium]|nr:hypothetical protein [Acidobacteriaceae bacterium]